MKRDPLESLVRLRRLAADEARRGLADCLRDEEAAAHAVAAIEADIERETEAAANLATSDAEVEAFAAWLRRIRPIQYAAHVAVDRTEAETVRARAVLAAARSAVEPRRKCWQSMRPPRAWKRNAWSGTHSTKRHSAAVSTDVARLPRHQVVVTTSMMTNAKLLARLWSSNTRSAAPHRDAPRRRSHAPRWPLR
jgi:hypothetical protein